MHMIYHDLGKMAMAGCKMCVWDVMSGMLLPALASSFRMDKAFQK